jgi:hypothetical protein
MTILYGPDWLNQVVGKLVLNPRDGSVRLNAAVYRER